MKGNSKRIYRPENGGTWQMEAITLSFSTVNFMGYIDYSLAIACT